METIEGKDEKIPKCKLTTNSTSLLNKQEDQIQENDNMNTMTHY